VIRNETCVQRVRTACSVVKDPKDGMFIVSCWPLKEAGPVCFQRCDAVLSMNAYLVFCLCLIIILQDVSLFYVDDILYTI
jgi:hypothetical protein